MCRLRVLPWRRRQLLFRLSILLDTRVPWKLITRSQFTVHIIEGGSKVMSRVRLIVIDDNESLSQWYFPVCHQPKLWLLETSLYYTNYLNYTLSTSFPISFLYIGFLLYPLAHIMMQRVSDNWSGRGLLKSEKY